MNRDRQKVIDILVGLDNKISSYKTKGINDEAIDGFWEEDFPEHLLPLEELDWIECYFDSNQGRYENIKSMKSTISVLAEEKIAFVENEFSLRIVFS